MNGVSTAAQRYVARPGTLAVTGSKGGVGKSNLVANLAIALARWGRRVLLVDGDLGLANLDVLLGLMPERNLDHVMRGEATLDDVLLEGPEGIRFLPAASGVPELASLDSVFRRRLLDALCSTSEGTDDVLVDTGAGLGDTTLALQLAASRVIVVTTPEPTSLVDAYATLKVLWGADPTKPVDLVVNAVADTAEAERAHDQISRAAEHFLGRSPRLLGSVCRDPRVSEAVHRQKPVLQLFPEAPAGKCYEQIALRLTLSRTDDPAGHYWERLIQAADEGVSH